MCRFEIGDRFSLGEIAFYSASDAAEYRDLSVCHIRVFCLNRLTDFMPLASNLHL